jgi:hypothetical protein
MTPEARIAEVHASDVANARNLLRQAIETARERWIPGNAIADALILELIDFGSNGAPAARVSAYLRGVATLFDRSTTDPKAN